MRHQDRGGACCADRREDVLRTSSRRAASSAENGSSRSTTCGEGASARATATRRCMPLTVRGGASPTCRADRPDRANVRCGRRSSGHAGRSPRCRRHSGEGTTTLLVGPGRSRGVRAAPRSLCRRPSRSDPGDDTCSGAAGRPGSEASVLLPEPLLPRIAVTVRSERRSRSFSTGVWANRHRQPGDLDVAA